MDLEVVGESDGSSLAEMCDVIKMSKKSKKKKGAKNKGLLDAKTRSKELKTKGKKNEKKLKPKENLPDNESMVEECLDKTDSVSVDPVSKKTKKRKRKGKKKYDELEKKKSKCCKNIEEEISESKVEECLEKTEAVSRKRKRKAENKCDESLLKHTKNKSKCKEHTDDEIIAISEDEIENFAREVQIKKERKGERRSDGIEVKYKKKKKKSKYQENADNVITISENENNNFVEEVQRKSKRKGEQKCNEVEVKYKTKRKKAKCQDNTENAVNERQIEELDRSNSLQPSKKKKRKAKKIVQKGKKTKHAKENGKINVDDRVTDKQSNMDDVKLTKVTRNRKKKSLDPVKVFSHSEYCKCKGCAEMYNKGKWSLKERHILDQNIIKIGEQYEAKDLMSDLNKDVHLKNGDILGWNQFTKQSCFYEYVRLGLNRSGYSIVRAIRIKKVGNHAGVYSKTEIEKLRTLHSTHGNKWKRIGDQMDRSVDSVLSKFSKLGGNRGTWTDEEVDNLNRAIRLLTKTKEGTPVFTGVKWNTVSQIVGSRNYHQCHMKWTKSPKLALKISDNPKWTSRDIIALICKVYSSDASEECQIDFADICASWNTPTAVSPQLLALKWGSIKRRYLVDLANMNFDDIIDELYNIHMPKLKSKIEDEEKCIEESKSEKTRKNK